MQKRVLTYVKLILKNTTAGMKIEGLTNDDLRGSRLFVSNHRDITLDPTFVNYALRANGHQTMQIAIGDNLLQVPFVTKLMRLNKSFLVKRNDKQTRVEKYANLQQLSHYINHVIAQNEHIWIAQRDGRAKDGIDKTDSSVLKMLCLHDKKTKTNREILNDLRITPVAISYEWDPCDIMKAKEIAEKRKTGCYVKKSLEDIFSIKTGMVGHKGHIHVTFCPKLTIETDDIATITTIIDKSVTKGFRLMVTHLAAYIWICKNNNISTNIPLIPIHYSSDELTNAENKLLSRADGESDDVRDIMMHSYANPVFHYLHMHHGIDAPWV